MNPLNYLSALWWKSSASLRSSADSAPVNRRQSASPSISMMKAMISTSVVLKT